MKINFIPYALALGLTLAGCASKESDSIGEDLRNSYSDNYTSTEYGSIPIEYLVSPQNNTGFLFDPQEEVPSLYDVRERDILFPSEPLPKENEILFTRDHNEEIDNFTINRRISQRELPNFLRRKLLPKAGKALVGFLVNDVFNFASPIKDYVEKYLPKGTEIYGNKLRYHFGTGNEEMVQVRVCKSSLRLNYSNPGIIAGCKISLGKVKFKCDLGMHW